MNWLMLSVAKHLENKLTHKVNSFGTEITEEERFI